MRLTCRRRRTVVLFVIIAASLVSTSHSMTTTKSQNDLVMMEFFSGIGGMRLAVEQALEELRHDDNSRQRRIAACHAYDISLHANRCYQHNFSHQDGRVSTKLVEQLKPKDLPHANLWTMSPPCQPFTTTRGAKGLDLQDKRCHGLLGLMALLKQLEQKPRWVFLENVKGFADSEMCRAWKACLAENGYSYKEYLLSPIQLGIPNHRLRYYILCERSDRWNSESQIHTEPPSGTPFQQRFVRNYVNPKLEDLDSFIVQDDVLQMEWAKDLGIVAGADTATRCFTAGYGRILSKATGSVLLFQGSKEQDATATNDSSSHHDQAIAEHPIDRSNMLQYSGRLRRFTPTELLRLFGFPSSFNFPSDIPLEHHYKLVGNSINVSTVALLLKDLLSAAAGDAATISTSQAITDHEDQKPLASIDDYNGETFQTIGGVLGHVPETIRGNLLRLYRAFRWKPIPNCTGRYTCRDHSLVSSLKPLELLAQAGIFTLEDDNIDDESLPADNESRQASTLVQYSFDLPGRHDTVLIVPLDSHHRTGVITFQKSNIAYVHTLNSPSGFRRKLLAMGINYVADDTIAMSAAKVPTEEELAN